MKSPFPGMDPYLENHWRDFHASMVVYASDAISAKLPKDLRCRIDEREIIQPVNPDDETPAETYLRILEANSRRVVTVLEFLTPVLKRAGVPRSQLPSIRREPVEFNVVYVDLLRSGLRAPEVDESNFPEQVRRQYRVSVIRFHRPECIELYCSSLREKLPRFRIPLRESDADVILNLQQLLDQCFQRGRYDDIDYSVPPRPPLEGDDAEWAKELLAAKPK